MRSRLAIAAAGLLAVAAVPADGSAYEPSSETIHNIVGCVVGADGTTCESTTRQLSTVPGDQSVGTVGSVTPLNSAIYYVDGDYVPDTYAPGPGVKGETFIVDASEPLTGQVTLNGWVQDARVAADAAVFVQLSLRYQDAVTGTSRTSHLSAEVEKPVMTPVDYVFAYEIDIPEELHEVEVTITGMDIATRGVNVLTSGFTNGEGGSFFVLPTLEVVEAE